MGLGQGLEELRCEHDGVVGGEHVFEFLSFGATGFFSYLAVFAGTGGGMASEAWRLAVVRLDCWGDGFCPSSSGFVSLRIGGDFAKREDESETVAHFCVDGGDVFGGFDGDGDIFGMQPRWVGALHRRHTLTRIEHIG